MGPHNQHSDNHVYHRGPGFYCFNFKDIPDIRIPYTLTFQKFYVAHSLSKADSSWDTLLMAEACVGRLALLYPSEFKKCQGILRVNRKGREWMWRKYENI